MLRILPNWRFLSSVILTNIWNVWSFSLFPITSFICGSQLSSFMFACHGSDFIRGKLYHDSIFEHGAPMEKTPKCANIPTYKYALNDAHDCLGSFHACVYFFNATFVHTNKTIARCTSFNHHKGFYHFHGVNIFITLVMLYFTHLKNNEYLKYAKTRT